MFRWMLWLGIAFAVVLNAQTPAQIEPRMLRVIVEDGLAQPMPNVEVSLRTFNVQGGEPVGVPITTNREGAAEFRIAGDFGSYDVSAAYGGLKYTRRVSAVGSLTTITTLPVGGVLSGRVHTANGDPAAGVRVWAGLAVVLDGKKTIREWIGAETAADGTYRVPIISTGEYFIRTGSTESVPKLTDRYYPLSRGVATAEAVFLRAGMTTGGLHLYLGEEATYRVSGRVVLPPGAAASYGSPNAPITFVITPPNNSLMGAHVTRTAMLAEDGKFELDGIPSGEWEILAQIFRNDLSRNFTSMINNDPVFRYALGRERVYVNDKDIDALVVRISPSDLKGKILRLPDGVTARNVRLLSTGYMPTGLLSSPVQNGEFSLRGIPPGRYALQVELPADYYVSSIRVGASLISETDGTFEAGNGDIGPIEITAHRGTGGVEGTLRSLEPGELPQVTPLSRVILAPAPPREQNLSLYRVTTIAAVQGAFSFQNVPPGEYRIFALTRPPGQTPDVLMRYATFATTVIVREGGPVQVEAYLIPDVK